MRLLAGCVRSVGVRAGALRLRARALLVRTGVLLLPAGALFVRARAWVNSVGVWVAPARVWVKPVGALLVPAALVAVALLAGCGDSVELPDLFVVQRWGSVPGAHLTIVVNEGGAVHCNSEPASRTHPARPGIARQLSDPQLVQARGLSEELQGPSAKHLSLPARPGSVFRYYVRDAEGAVRFADNSAGQPAVLHHLAYFVLEVAQKVCGLGE